MHLTHGGFCRDSHHAAPPDLPSEVTAVIGETTQSRRLRTVMPAPCAESVTGARLVGAHVRAAVR